MFLSNGATRIFCGVQKQDSSGTAKPIWDLENILLETDQNDTTQVIYTLQPVQYGNLISQLRGSTASYYHFDGLGSTDRLTNSTLTVTDSYLYEGFGRIRTSSGTTTNPFRYVGNLSYYYDADPLQFYVRARHYLPTMGRWISRDPRLGLSEQNLYEYVSANPVNSVDPSGLVVLVHYCEGARVP